jgi:predicted secreted hydrolase
LLRADSDLRAQVKTDGFAMDLRFATSQNVLLQGQQGLSRKGPEVQQTSYYYSLPQLRVTGSLTLQGKTVAVPKGTAWLDHEWSDEILPAGALGWDWLGINLFDGSALTAFQLRDKSGAALWDGGSFRSSPGSGSSLYPFSRGEVTFKPLRSWRSPQSGASYPVEWMVRTPADFYTVRALVDNQELDSRQSTGAIYWEGLCEVWDSNLRLVGRGYLEMTGYAAPLVM